MTPSNGNIVPFERPAAYWAVRARRHYTPSQLPDAARLMRKALEKSGEGALALELSRIYGSMECCTAAERCLLRASARLGLTGSVCYLISCCALSRGWEDLAERALDESLRLEPDGVYADEAQDMLDLYPWRQERYRPGSARGEFFLLLSQRAKACGRGEEALRLAKKAWKRARTPEIALWLGGLLKPGKALAHLAFAAQGLPGEMEPRLLLARAFHETGHQEEAKRQLTLARVMCQTIDQAEKYCEAAWEAGEGEQALAMVSQKLERSPASADYLRLRYLCLRRLAQDGDARRTLETLLEIDPDDTLALHYRRHPEDVILRFDSRDLLSALGSLVYARPERLRRGPMNRMLHLMVMYLAGHADTETIYRLLPPVWRRLTKGERRACDDRQARAYPVALGAFVLRCTGQEEAARRMIRQTEGKRRVLRLLRRFERWISEEDQPCAASILTRNFSGT